MVYNQPLTGSLAILHTPMNKNLSFTLLLLIFLFTITYPMEPLLAATALDQRQDDEIPSDSAVLLQTDVVSTYLTLETYALADGTLLELEIINGPPMPPPGYESERVAIQAPFLTRGIPAYFPSYSWVLGCSAVSGAMIAGHYDRIGYPNMYTGPTNGGVMPPTDTYWPTWVDGQGARYVNNPLVASKDGVDGRIGRGTIDNYWVSYLSTADDPYITNSWPNHAWGTAIGDFMKTSQSAYPYQNVDGSTWFWNYPSGSPLDCSAMEVSLTMPAGQLPYYISENDGTYGRKLFYEARGYTVTDCYNQQADTIVETGFSLEDFQNQIDAGHPVLLNLEGHSIVGYGYSGSTIYIRDTWDSNPENIYTMTWGSSYMGMPLRSVSVVNLEPSDAPQPAAPADAIASTGTFFDRVRICWDASDNTSTYKIFRNTSKVPKGPSNCPADLPPAPWTTSLPPRVSSITTGSRRAMPQAVQIFPHPPRVGETMRLIFTCR
jgi:hypothetical protein